MVFTTQKRPALEGEIRVLYVDDEENPLIIAKRYLEKLDNNLLVNVTSSPEEAIRVQGSYDCIITDYRMPKMSGIELAQRIRETSGTPIILYTAYGSEEVAEKASSVGIDDYISKGFDYSHYRMLAERIRSAVERHRRQSTGDDENPSSD